ncbi:hypothetical protein, partial [Rubrivirga sp.]|uniref:hypothetical protein n=1 Tax=Rubrivirga sp. TaxID=1885344 RepID=UPI003C73158E
MRLLALALCASAGAQPSAADSALVDRALLGLGYDLEGDAEIWGPTGPNDPGVLVRDAFLEDLDRIALEDAVAFFETPAWRHLEGPP